MKLMFSPLGPEDSDSNSERPHDYWSLREQSLQVPEPEIYLLLHLHLISTFTPEDGEGTDDSCNLQYSL